jgi:hypothetical protein
MVGSISLIVMLLTFYFALTIPGVGPSTPQADAILLTIFVVGAVVYTIGYLYHKGHGIDMKAIYSELPPE